MDITGNFIDDSLVEVVMAGRTIPVVCGWNPDGTPHTTRDLHGRTLRDPATCPHVRANWSSNIVCKCPDCGRDMFLPPALLAFLSAADLTAMRTLWAAAGWPDFDNRTLAWRLHENHWTVEEHPLFAHCGGLAVRSDRQDHYHDMVRELEL